MRGIKKKLLKYRLTSYYPAETSNITGSGLTTADFEVNDHGWYTYNGKLVMAGATEELLSTGYSYRQEGKYYFNYFDEIRVQIDGFWYDAIILDSSGLSHWPGYFRLDMFVIDAAHVKDTTILIEIEEEN